MRNAGRIIRAFAAGIVACTFTACGSQVAVEGTLAADATDEHQASQSSIVPGSGLRAPVRLEADGEPIDIGKLSNFAHAGPWIADVDNDGDRDLLVGDFPGHFWLFHNAGSDGEPRYTSKGKLQAGGEDAKTPVY